MIEVEVKIPIENIEKIKKNLLETGLLYKRSYDIGCILGRESG